MLPTQTQKSFCKTYGEDLRHNYRCFGVIITMTLMLLCIPGTVRSSDIRIYNKHFRILPEREAGNYKAITEENYPDLKNVLTFTISWDHSWRNKRNYDAAWVFVKLYPDPESGFPTRATDYVHAKITSAVIVDTPGAGSKGEITISDDQLGFFIYPNEPSRGRVTWTVSLSLAAQDLYHFGSPFAFKSEIHALEMVYIPEAPFYLGAVDESMLGLGAYYRSGGDGSFDGPYKIESELPIETGQNKGGLWYHNFGGEVSRGDHQGPVPGGFPKGYQAFYIMKYELTQGQYAAFLNSLHDYGTDFRSNIGGRNYYKNRGTIVLKGQKYEAGDPDRPANHLSWADVMSYLDWAALRPMTEMEVEKAAKGPEYPKPRAYAWGDSNLDKLQRGYFADGSYGMFNDMHEGNLDDSNRAIYGASWYWVMDLSGGLSEAVVAASTEPGRKFRGSHGDGMVEVTYAEKGNEDWPPLDKLATGQEASGGGFKGGGVVRLNEVGNDAHPFDHVSSRYGVDRAVVMLYRSAILGCRGVRTASKTSR